MDDDLPVMFEIKDGDDLAINTEEEEEEDRWIVDHAVLLTTNSGRSPF